MLLLARTDGVSTAADPRTAIFEHLCQLLHPLQQGTDALTERYFRDLHQWLPFLSATAVGVRLERFPESRETDFGFMLLTIYLTARQPPEGQNLTQQELYIEVKDLWSKMQLFTSASYHLAAGGTLLAMYEYACQDPDSAFITLSITIRMGYAIGLDRIQSGDATQLMPHSKKEMHELWWVMVICERCCALNLQN